jgi:hypothetical protein
MGTTLLENQRFYSYDVIGTALFENLLGITK